MLQSLVIPGLLPPLATARNASRQVECGQNVGTAWVHVGGRPYFDRMTTEAVPSCPKCSVILELLIEEPIFYLCQNCASGYLADLSPTPVVACK